MSVRVRLMVTSLVLGLVLIGIKGTAAYITGSVALASDAIEGVVNIAAAAFGLWAIRFAESPADRNHPYGHGRIEFFASAFEGSLILLAAIFIVVSAAERIQHPAVVGKLDYGILLSACAGIGNGVLGYHLWKQGKKLHSKLIEADGIHLMTDLASSVAIILGLIAVMLTGWNWLDAAIAIAVAVWMVRTSAGLLFESVHALLDRDDPEFSARLVTVLNRVTFKEIIAVHEMRTRRVGSKRVIDWHIVVPEYMTVSEAHHKVDHITAVLSQELSEQSEFVSHTDPCEQRYCSSCEVDDCKIRLGVFQSKIPFTVESITERGLI
jgi:cation diffusion facilitator family transporter